MAILDNFAAFSEKQLADAASVLRFMRKKGISDKAFLEAVDTVTEANRQKVQKDAAVKAPVQKKSPEPYRQPQKNRDRQYPENLACPKCGRNAYAQPVCPSCKKGRAGIRREYICGECNFAFYLD